MQTQISILPKSLEIKQYDEITEEMKERMLEYQLSLHGIKESTKDDYLSKIKMLGRFLTKREIMRFEDVNRRDIDLFLSKYENENTKNLYMHAFRSFYKSLNKQEVISHLKLYKIELEQITPSEILTPEEVITLANEASKRRELARAVRPPRVEYSLTEKGKEIARILNELEGKLQNNSP